MQDKKVGPPPQSNLVKGTKPIKPKNNLTVNKISSNKIKRAKTIVDININDGLKYLNFRENLIDILESKKLKASQLAYKITECYPLAWNCSDMCESSITKYENTRVAGKKPKEGDHMKDIFTDKNVLQESNVHI